MEIVCGTVWKRQYLRRLQMSLSEIKRFHWLFLPHWQAINYRRLFEKVLFFLNWNNWHSIAKAFPLDRFIKPCECIIEALSMSTIRLMFQEKIENRTRKQNKKLVESHKIDFGYSNEWLNGVGCNFQQFRHGYTCKEYENFCGIKRFSHAIAPWKQTMAMKKPPNRKRSISI